MTDGLAGKLPVAVKRGSSPVANHVAGYRSLATKNCDTEDRHAAGHKGSVARFRSYATFRLLDRDQPGSEVLKTDCLDAVRDRIGFGAAIDNEAAGGFQVLAGDQRAPTTFV
jgi:hypothetical protein